MPKKYTLVKFEANWNDVVECEQFIILNIPVKRTTSLIKEMLNSEDDLYFGTERYFESSSLTLDNFAVESINERERFVLEEKFGGTIFGTGILGVLEYMQDDESQDHEELLAS